MKSFISLFLATQFCFLNYGFACGAFVPHGAKEYPVPSDEVALIIWDEKNGVQHFIRQAKFNGKTKNFAFVVPVPSTPDLEEAPENLFGWIHQDLYSPRTFGKGEGFGGSGSLGAARGAVTVVKQQEVAGMDASVIRSTDAKALQKWLNTNGYEVPKSALSWIDHYVKKNWEFVAFKIKSSTDKDEKIKIASPLVRISFKTLRPFYPYREPDYRKPVKGRELSLFVIAPYPVTGAYESKKEWNTKHDFSNEFKYVGNMSKKTRFDEVTHTGDYLSKIFDRELVQESMYVSHFRNDDEIRPAEDLYFEKKTAKK